MLRLKPFRLAAPMAFCVLIFYFPSSNGLPISFSGLGDLPGGEFLSSPRAISDDGLTVVGVSESAAGQRAFVYDVGNQSLNVLPSLPGGGSRSQALGISADGNLIVGGSQSANTGTGINDREAFVYDRSAGTITGLGDLPGGTFTSAAQDISADGRFVVGTSVGRFGAGQAFVYDRSTQSLTDLSPQIAINPNGSSSSSARAISNDGSTVTGIRTVGPNGFEGYVLQITGGTVTGLGDFAGGDFTIAPRDISGDGRFIVGTGSTDDGNRAFGYDTITSTFSGLGLTPDGGFAIDAMGSSFDGSVVVGVGSIPVGNGGFNNEAVVWTAADGLRTVRAILEDLGIGDSIAGWRLGSVQAVSADGLTFVGAGRNPNNDVEAFIYTVPEPVTASLLLMCFITNRSRTHKNRSKPDLLR